MKPTLIRYTPLYLFMTPWEQIFWKYTIFDILVFMVGEVS